MKGKMTVVDVEKIVADAVHAPRCTVAADER